jgi:hypothetical protein
MSGQTLQIDTPKRPPPVGIFPTNHVGEKSAREVNFTRQALLCLHYFLFLGYHRGAVSLHGTVDQGVVELLPNVNFVTPSRSDLSVTASTAAETSGRPRVRMRFSIMALSTHSRIAGHATF